MNNVTRCPKSVHRYLISVARCEDDMNPLPQVKVMKALEKQLDKAGGKFITGGRMTLADFVLLSQLQDLKLLRLESGDYPRHGDYANLRTFTNFQKLVKFVVFKASSIWINAIVSPTIGLTTPCRAMQYEKDVLATSEGFREIFKADGVWFKEALPQAQELMK